MGDLRLLDPPDNGSPTLHPLPSSETLLPNSFSKRQRRPSVRLGEIGEQPAHDPSLPRRSKFPKPHPPALPLKPSPKSRQPAKRPRTNWPARLDEGFEAAAPDLKSSGGEDSRDDEFVEDSRDEHSDEGFKGWSGGVRPWLEGLGLGRYAPVYEIHEVDDEALPLLTLEDLKDMGINAVGSRRKMYCAIQKLRKSREL